MTIHDGIDWSTDFDVGDPGYQADPFEVWDELRATCPVARTQRRGGAVLLTRYDDIAAVAHDVETFSNVDPSVLPLVPGAGLLTAPPITSDPPFHTESRRILLPFFSPRAVDQLEPATRDICDALVDELAGCDTADAAADYARHIPVRVIAHMLGVPPAEEDRFTDWAVRIFQGGTEDQRVIRAAVREVLAYFAEQVESRRVEPRDDLISHLLEAELDGAPLTDRHILGSCFLLLLAGIDTTWSAIGSSLWHLAAHPADRDRLVEDPGAIPTAVEELLRAYAPVTMARVTTTDTEIAGCPVGADDKVLLSFPAGNRDPDRFDRADEVVIDRERNRHFAFGIGIHRCIGSNVARMELRVALETWLARFPRFTLRPGAEVRWNGVQVRGPREVPVTLG